MTPEQGGLMPRVSSDVEILAIEREMEPVARIIETLVTGARLNLQHLNKPQTCIEHAEFALKLCEKYGGQTDIAPDIGSFTHCNSSIGSGCGSGGGNGSAWYGLAVPPALHAQALQFLAAGSGAVAMHTSNPEIRRVNQSFSLETFAKAAELSSDNAELHYQYALQLAEGRETLQAIAMVKRALQLNNKHLPSFNLLALLLSSQQDLQGALKACAIGLHLDIQKHIQQQQQQQQRSNSPSDVPPLNSIVYPRPPMRRMSTGMSSILSSQSKFTTNASNQHQKLQPHQLMNVSSSQINTGGGGSIEEGEEYLDLKITQSRLLELLHGPEVALILHGSVFALFARIYPAVINPDQKQNNVTIISAGTTGPVNVNRVYSDTQQPTTATSTATTTTTVTAAMAAMTIGAVPATQAVDSNVVELVSQQVDSGSDSESDSGSDSSSGDTSSSDNDEPAHIHENGEQSSDEPLSSPEAISATTSSVGIPTVPVAIHKTLTKTSAHIEQLKRRLTFKAGSKKSKSKEDKQEKKTKQTSDVTGQQQQQQQQQQQSTTAVDGSTAPAAGRLAPVVANKSLPPPYQGRPVATKASHHIARGNRVLSFLWLTSADAFRRLGRYDQAFAAITESQKHTPESAEAWYQRGLISLSLKDDADAKAAFSSAVALEPNHVGTLVKMAEIFFEEGQTAMAEGLLQAATKARGWDLAEAWYLIGKIATDEGDLDKAKDSLMYALQLDTTKPARSYHILPR
ncbi:TPR-like protein [Ramicandelaber brevisporus]|nr:TPR-like protein [Ramicandelaber brevisporus]